VDLQSEPLLFQEELYHFSSPVVVVLPKTWDSYSAEQQQLLNKILTSVKINIDAVRMVVVPAGQRVSPAGFGAQRVLIFGCQPPDDTVLYSETTAQGFKVIWADDLSQLDDQKKKNLWTALRQMFGV
jgi:hypothetical protein